MNLQRFIALCLMISFTQVHSEVARKEILVEHQVHPKIPIFNFVLRASEDGRSPESLVISEKNSKAPPIQVIPSLETDLSWEDMQRPNVLEFWDMNFDGHDDFLLLTTSGTGQSLYTIWLFSPKERKFIFNSGLSALPSPRPLPEKKQIQSSSLSGAGAEVLSKYYNFKNGKLVLLMELEQTFKDVKGERHYRRVVKSSTGKKAAVLCDMSFKDKTSPVYLKGNAQKCLLQDFPLGNQD